ncbi:MULTISPECIES: spore coat associated protein CotJA [unclassified Ruminococcus]|uniref:spore coat associated protein CotJA n=1 Tax=unclassified Ruminococcus TaxID=2608920 RepID=UPI00210C2051|nr:MULTISPECIES: spore coat associated protein CotJA [unclassified Ruminococcus]
MDNDIFKMKMPEYGITPLPEDPVPAMAYIPFQNNDKLYSADQGIVTGTMFPVLNKPFKCGFRR